MKWKIRTKIFASTVLVVSASLLFSGFFIYDYAKGIIREQSIKDSRTKLAQISFQLKKVQEQAVKTAEYIISDDEISSLVYAAPAADLAGNYYRKTGVQDRLKRFAALNPSILNIVLIRPDGEYFSNNPGYQDYFRDYFKQEWFHRQPAERITFSEPHSFFTTLNKEKEVFSYIVKFRPGGDPELPDSYLVLDIDYSEITSAFRQSAGDFGVIELRTSSGAVLYRSHAYGRGDGEFLQEAREVGSSFLEDSSRIGLTDDGMIGGWRQYALLSKSVLFEKINRIFWFYLIIICSGAAAGMLVMLPIILKLTKPLILLTGAMKRVSLGDLNTSVSIRSGDELEILGYGFNRMVSELKNHIESSVQHEQTKRKMQISLLMSQINPHFVYNTLNTIIYLCHAGRNKEAAEMTQTLIAILQDTIKTGEGEEFARLDEEWKMVEKYAVIQMTRYPGKFRLEWEVEPELQHERIPRMLLQPLVENALLHGIFPDRRDRQGLITIRAGREKEMLVLEVMDNGIGFREGEGEPAAVGPDRKEPGRTREGPGESALPISGNG